MAKSDRVRYVSTFRAPTEYERQLEEARRRAALAEALAQQEYQPMEGAAAPIPRAAPLVKALQGYLTAREGRKAREAEAEASQVESDYAQRMLGRMQGGYTPDTAAMERIAREGQRTPEQIAASMPAETTLAEVTPTSRYVKSPEEALNMASTNVGTAALKNRPVLASRLAEMLKTPETKTMEFGNQLVNIQGGRATPVVDASGNPLSKPADQPAPTPLARLIAERNALPPNDPRIPTYEAAINAETQGKGTTVNVPPSPRDLRKDEGGLRDELKGRLKEMDWEGVRSAYQRIFTAPENAVGDVAIVYAVAKADDPTGAVRKEDFDLRAKDGSLGGRIKALYEEASTGRMLPERRQQLIDTAYELYTARQNDVNTLLGQYQDIAQRSGLNVENVVNPFKSKVLGRRIVWSKEKQEELDRLARQRAGG